MPGPISGIRIVDLTTILMGPYATRLLADLGADVIKVESPQIDSMRTVKPSRHPEMAGAILNLHANKRSIVLDLKSAEAKQTIIRLIKTADVFIHNMRPAAIERLGLSYDQLSKVNSEIVYCNAYGYGRNGPYADKAAYDDAIQAASGVPSLFERARGSADYFPGALCDKVAGLTITYSILAALLGRSRGRGGQEIEVPMFETAVSFNAIEHLCGFAFEPPLSDFGWQRILAKKRRPYRTKDGHVCILPYTTENWHAFFNKIGRADLVADKRFLTHPDRIAHTDYLYGLIEEHAVSQTNTEWISFCDENSIPCMPANDLADLWNDPHLKAVGLLGYADHPTEGRYKTIGMPTNFFGTPVDFQRHAPRPGEHTEEILRELDSLDRS